MVVHLKQSCGENAPNFEIFIEKMQMILSDRDTRLLEERDSVSAYGAVDAASERRREVSPSQ